jgi:hypothetical protein
MAFKLREFIFRPKRRQHIKRQLMYVEGIYVELIQKSVRNISISILPPDGKVRVTAPLKADYDVVKSFVVRKLEWIRKHQHKMRQRPVEPEKRFVTSELHLLFGKPHKLLIKPANARSSVALKDDVIEMHVPDDSTVSKRKLALDGLYRKELRRVIPGMIRHWEPVMNVAVNDFGIRLMKTRWGTCNVRAQRIWLNLELAKKPPECLEYIVVHEMVHLLERNHTRRFHSLMDKFMPDWRERQKMLNNYTALPVD